MTVLELIYLSANTICLFFAFWLGSRIGGNGYLKWQRIIIGIFIVVLTFYLAGNVTAIIFSAITIIAIGYLGWYCGKHPSNDIEE
jgi:hypothetical protein